MGVTTASRRVRAAATTLVALLLSVVGCGGGGGGGGKGAASSGGGSTISSTSSAVVFTPSSLDFGSVKVGQDATTVLTIDLAPGAALFSGSVTVSGAAFSITSGSGPFVLTPGSAAVTVGVRFAPTTTGPHKGAVIAGAATAALDGQGDPAQPNAPSGFTATAAGASQIDLAWADNSNDEEGFLLERGLTATMLSPVATIASNVTVFKDTGLAAGTTYHYRLTATKTVPGSSIPVTASATTTQATAAVLATGLDRPWSLAADATNVYWVENGSQGSVKKVAIAGGTAVTLATGLVEASAVCVDGTSVYWLERNGGSNGMLRRVPIAGGQTETLATGLLNAQNYLAQDAGAVYFGDGKPGGGGTIKKVLKAAPFTLTTLVASGILNLAPAIAVQGKTVYFSDDVSNIKSVPADGGAVVTLGTGRPSGLAVDGTHLYWSDYQGGTIEKMPIAGGQTTTIAAGSTSPAAVATDGVNVYWTEFNNPGRVQKVAVSGGAVTSVATSSNSLGLAVDATYVFWAESVFTNGGKLQRAPK